MPCKLLQTKAMDVCTTSVCPTTFTRTLHLSPNWYYHPLPPHRLSTQRPGNRLLEGLSEHQDLHLIVDGQNTSTSDTTENVGTSTLEERFDTLLGDDLTTSI